MRVAPLSSFMISIWITLLFSTLVLFRCRKSRLYWKGDSTLYIYAMDWNHSCILEVFRVINDLSVCHLGHALYFFMQLEDGCYNQSSKCVVTQFSKMLRKKCRGDISKCNQINNRVGQPMSDLYTQCVLGIIMFQSMHQIVLKSKTKEKLPFWEITYCIENLNMLVFMLGQPSNILSFCVCEYSALAAFYTRELVEMFPSVKAPSLEVISFQTSSKIYR